MEMTYHTNRQPTFTVIETQLVSSWIKTKQNCLQLRLLLDETVDRLHFKIIPGLAKLVIA